MDYKEDLQDLREEFLYQVNIILPELARQTGKYPIMFNHCWCRILYDNLVGQCWYACFDTTKGPAYKQLSCQQLNILLGWIEAMKENPNLVKLMNNNSLRWRTNYE